VKLNFGGKSYEMTAGYHATDGWHHVPHSGIDIGMVCGTPVKAPISGVIEKVVDYGHTNIGRGVIMKADDGNHLIFGHLSENGGVHVGQHIDAGQVVGISGTTGRSSGCHLHLGAKDPSGQHFIDPSGYLDGTKHIVRQAVDKVHLTSDSVIDMFNQQFQQFGDQIAHWSLEFIHLSLQLAIPKACLILHTILFHLL
jgi:murein DD-endopeptidase MepM/ murein hydrolase activator NlpD